MRLLLLWCLVALPALAQVDRPARAEKRELVFDDADLIEGTTSGPQVELIEKARAPRRTSLLKVRTDFRREALASIHQL